MSLSDLPTLVDRLRMECPKGPTRLEQRNAADREIVQAWETCKRAVDIRDTYQCRNCERKVVKTLRMQKDRAEHHHIVRRQKEPALMNDPRNVVLLCLECHQQVTCHKLHIIGKAADMFVLNGVSYLDAEKPLEFMA